MWRQDESSRTTANRSRCSTRGRETHGGAGRQRASQPSANALAEAGLRIAVIGTGESERPVVDAVMAGLKADSLDLWERTSLSGLVGLLSRSRLIVSNDSGPLHLAAAVGMPAVGIYWAFNLLNAGTLTRTRFRPLVSWRLECPVCGVNCLEGQCDHRRSFVADVPVEEVVAQAIDVLRLAANDQTNQ